MKKWNHLIPWKNYDTYFGLVGWKLSPIVGEMEIFNFLYSLWRRTNRRGRRQSDEECSAREIIVFLYQPTSMTIPSEGENVNWEKGAVRSVRRRLRFSPFLPITTILIYFSFSPTDLKRNFHFNNQFVSAFNDPSFFLSICLLRPSVVEVYKRERNNVQRMLAGGVTNVIINEFSAYR